MSRKNSEDANTFSSIKRHEEYYLPGGDLHFLIERHIFRVHKYFFERESSYFKNKLAVPVTPGQDAQGTSDSNSIVLDDVRSSDFARFLWVFYNPKYSLYDTTVEDWTSILDLATRWKFPEVKALAVRQLEQLEIPDIDRIVIYHQYEVDRTLLIPRYAALCTREQTLTLPEGMRLGMETTLMLARARECARSKPAGSGARSPSPANLDSEEMHAIVKDVFNIAPPSPKIDPTTTPPADGGSLVDLNSTTKEGTAELGNNGSTNGSATGGATNGSATNGDTTSGLATNGVGSPLSPLSFGLGGGANTNFSSEGTNGTNGKGPHDKSGGRTGTKHGRGGKP